MQFTQIPTQYAPIGGKVVYAFDTGAEAGEAIPDTEIHISNAADGAQLGAKRFAGVTAAAFDAAPYLRRAVRFVPVVGDTGFYAASAQGRTVTAKVEAAAVETETARTEAGTAKAVRTGTAATAAAPERTFLPCAEAVQAPAILTSMPLTRLIAPGECDELTLLTAGASTVTVTAETAEGLVAQSYHVSESGLHLFRLDTRDFPEAQIITVDAGACGVVVYTLLAAPEGARRLAWRSEAGSVEHYTFPVERSETLMVAKSQAENPEGRIQIITGHERRTVLASAYESRPVLEGLSGIICSGQVWEVTAEGYTRVEVQTREAVIDRQGTLSLLEIEVCSTRKTTQSWN